MNNLMRLVASLSALMSVAGCASMVRDRIYRPSSEHIDAPWLTTAPRPVFARTADGLDIHGLYWAPEGEAKPGRRKFVIGGAASASREKAPSVTTPSTRLRPAISSATAPPIDQPNK